jgi:hypothetical protein
VKTYSVCFCNLKPDSVMFVNLKELKQISSILFSKTAKLEAIKFIRYCDLGKNCLQRGNFDQSID